MTTQPPRPATASRAETTAAQATEPRPDGYAVSPAIGPLPAIYVRQPPSLACTACALWRAAARAARWAAARERERRLKLRLAELERRLRIDSTDSGTPSSKQRIEAKETRRALRQESERERRKDRRQRRKATAAVRNQLAGIPG